MSGTREARRVALESWNVNEACIGAGLSKAGTAAPIKTKAGDPSNLLAPLLAGRKLKRRLLFHSGASTAEGCPYNAKTHGASNIHAALVYWPLREATCHVADERFGQRDGEQTKNKGCFRKGASSVSTRNPTQGSECSFRKRAPRRKELCALSRRYPFHQGFFLLSLFPVPFTTLSAPSFFPFLPSFGDCSLVSFLPFCVSTLAI